MSEKNYKPVPVFSINHASMRVSNPKIMVEWLQGIFGFPIVARQGDSVVFRIGDGPQYFSILGEPTDKPGYTHFGFSVENFDPNDFIQRLKSLGYEQSNYPDAGKFTLRNRGADKGGAAEGTPELFIGDPDGLIVQIQDAKYAGGGGLLGDITYAVPEEAPTKGLVDTIELNHCTLGVSNGAESLKFYQSIFDLPVDTYQGPTPVLRVGTGNASLVLYELSGPEAKGVSPRIDHTCFAVKDFDVNRIEKDLGEFGMNVLGQAWRATGSLQTYYTQRMPDRGGDASGDTKELYLTDFDNNVIQLQDIRYAGGCGALGDVRGTGVDKPFEPCGCGMH
ncbi:VOC family protein [Sediminitomix flava]|uniref:Catechol-2,3-dioxygenase n=1 Tax=Sediminitomix flava TaxID=379075 RepID=A0A315ZB94_SEDFL|nr:VOC family protein [Sediminitomix flava]PWJ42429.1 catechol-2,3-dioxygenase [Sediminitomix flava]